MNTNLGRPDRITRMIFSAILIVLFFSLEIHSKWAIVLLILSVLLLATSIVGFCPLYWLTGISSKKSIKS